MAGRLNASSHLALTGNETLLLVADAENSRILAFERRRLRLDRVLVELSPEHGNPIRICIVQDTGMLLVGTGTAPTGIIVYSV